MNKKVQGKMSKALANAIEEILPVKGGWMEFENVCDHDDGFFCEHRQKYAIDKLTQLFSEIMEDVIPEEATRENFNGNSLLQLGYNYAVYEMREKAKEIIG